MDHLFIGYFFQLSLSGGGGGGGEGEGMPFIVGSEQSRAGARPPSDCTDLQRIKDQARPGGLNTRLADCREQKGDEKIVKIFQHFSLLSCVSENIYSVLI